MDEQKRKIIIGVIVVVVIAGFITIIALLVQSNNDNFETIQAHNGKQYHVRAEGDDQSKIQAANHLASMSSKVDQLVNYMVEKQLPSGEIANRLAHRWNKCSFKETSGGEKAAAYTVNKGDEMRLCIRNKGENNLEDHNTGMFVILHELGHLMSNTYGHNEEFRTNFSYVTHLASLLGLYKPQDFHTNPVNYCGTEINTTPCSSGTCSYNPSDDDPFNTPLAPIAYY